MEAILSVIAASSLGYIVAKLEKLEAKIANLEMIMTVAVDRRRRKEDSQLPEKREKDVL